MHKLISWLRGGTKRKQETQSNTNSDDDAADDYYSNLFDLVEPEVMGTKRRRVARPLPKLGPGAVNSMLKAIREKSTDESDVNKAIVALLRSNQDVDPQKSCSGNPQAVCSKFPWELRSASGEFQGRCWDTCISNRDPGRNPKRFSWDKTTALRIFCDVFRLFDPTTTNKAQHYRFGDTQRVYVLRDLRISGNGGLGCGFMFEYGLDDPGNIDIAARREQFRALCDDFERVATNKLSQAPGMSMDVHFEFEVQKVVDGGVDHVSLHELCAAFDDLQAYLNNPHGIGSAARRDNIIVDVAGLLKRHVSAPGGQDKPVHLMMHAKSGYEPVRTNQVIPSQQDDFWTSVRKTSRLSRLTDTRPPESFAPIISLVFSFDHTATDWVNVPIWKSDYQQWVEMETMLKDTNP